MRAVTPRTPARAARGAAMGWGVSAGSARLPWDPARDGDRVGYGALTASKAAPPPTRAAATTNAVALAPNAPGTNGSGSTPATRDTHDGRPSSRPSSRALTRQDAQRC